ncbi:MAG: 4Fe-4S dicluster domain-containing protein [Coriobacteriia bacterium]|nr:4Fe-4S dicluster domain-containing protein [Coriobacteriia bacterium]
MYFRILEKDQVSTFIEGLAHVYEVVAPVMRGGGYSFEQVRDGSEVELDYPLTIIPPKKYFVRPKECLFRYDSHSGALDETDHEVSPRVLFGVHACDINAILMTDKIFLGDYVDPYYKARRENTLIVGVSCMPIPTCMCNAWGTGEVSQGCDLFLTDLGDRYFVTCQSFEGAHILDTFAKTHEASAEDKQALEDHIREFSQAFREPVDTTQLQLLFDAKYNDPMWETIGDPCLSCGACSAVCPTCYCFDVVDELDADGVAGCRIRCWDSCLDSQFAEVAGGHDFRPTRASRVRYRFYHKFWAYPSRYGKMLCVGCGRCDVACKVDINPRRIVEALREGESK